MKVKGSAVHNIIFAAGSIGKRLHGIFSDVSGMGRISKKARRNLKGRLFDN
jgi:hypothetical protein